MSAALPHGRSGVGSELGERLAGAEFKVGIVWQGSTRNRRDRLRSVPLAEIAPLTEVKGVRVYSLQVGTGIEQFAQGRGIAELGSKFDASSFADAAAVLMNLELCPFRLIRRWFMSR